MRLSLVAALALPLASLRGQGPNSEAQDQVTFRALCGSCHGTTLVDGLRTEAEWQEEIDQMVKIGARGTPEQLLRVMRVLARTLTKVNVNTAEPPQIAPVLDVSEAVAQDVVKRRKSIGKFKSLEALKQVPGVDPAKLEARKERVLF